MRNSTILMSALALLITFSSCSKIKEELQRDVTITPTAVTFNIPAISSTSAGTTFGSYDANMDLDALIKAQASEFGEDNVKKIMLSSITLELLNSNADNNIQNFETIEVKLQTASGSPLTIAAAASIPNTQANTITVPLSGDVELKNYIGNGEFTYTIAGKLRKETTIVLNAKLTAQYKLTVGL